MILTQGHLCKFKVIDLKNAKVGINDIQFVTEGTLTPNREKKHVDVDLHLDLDGVDYNIQAYSPITTNKEVSLNFKSSGNNTFEIRVSQLISMDDDQEIYLKDNFTNTYFNLTDYKGYRFTSEEGVFKNRFQIVCST